MNRPIILFAAISVAALATLSPRLPAQQNGGDALASFQQAGCGGCHGADGRGTDAGPNLATSGLTAAQFTAFVRQPARTMPAYNQQALPDQALSQIFEALHAQSAPAPPTGRADSGGRLYAANGCYSCHSNEAQGGMHGPRLGPSPISFARFSWYVRHPTGSMPPYSTVVMSDQDVADVYAFVQSRPEPPPLASIPLLAP